MKTVYLSGGVVREIVPAEAHPVEAWYGELFAAQCVEAPDEVEQYWVYDHETGQFSPPTPYEPEPEQPSAEERLDAIEAAIERGLSL